jgi:hypothetical protein
VDNNPPLLTFRFRLIKGLERQAREDGLQLQGQNRDFAVAMEDELNWRRRQNKAERSGQRLRLS